MTIFSKDFLSKKFLSILFFVSGLYLFSCSSAPPETYQHMTNSWVGSDVNELLTYWGSPSDKKVMQDGNQYYTWLLVDGKKVESGYEDAIAQIDSKKISKWCKTIFIVNVKGKVKSANYDGNNCKVTLK